MRIIDQILDKVGYKYEDLNSDERDVLNGWIQALGKNEVTVERIREYIVSMKSSIENELTKTDFDSKKDILLKARLRNYMLLEAFLVSPKKARKALESAVAGMASNIK